MDRRLTTSYLQSGLDLMPEKTILSSTSDPSKKEIGLLLDLLPTKLRNLILKYDPELTFLELILDNAKEAELRLPTKQTIILPYIVTQTDLKSLTGKLPAFGKSGRTGVPKTLHRVSRVPDLNNETVGVTIRVGLQREAYLPLISDLLTGEESLLIIGPPGSGKTTLLRETCNYLSEEKHVIVVDKTNELGGEGNPPHPSLGAARRFQIPNGSNQSQVLLMALESHWPEVLVVDEVSTREEAEALLSVSRRGTKIIATAHARKIEDLIENPPLLDLMGKISTVTLGDDEAEKRATGKIVRERELAPVFDTVIQLDSFDRVSIYYTLKDVLDTYLSGGIIIPEERRLRDGEVLLTIPFKLGQRSQAKPINIEAKLQLEYNGNGKSHLLNGKKKT